MSKKNELGQIGEDFVAHWLESQGWIILQRRWSCLWGEIDIIAYNSNPQLSLPTPEATVAFVEVKTRSRGNWDLDGLLAISPRKQKKLCQTAELFLSNYTELAQLPARLDVALVRSAKLIDPGAEILPHGFAIGQTVVWRDYQLTLQNYIPYAFELG